MKKKYIDYIILLVIIILLSLVSLVSSPLYKGIYYSDPAVFKIMGIGLLQNKIMYKDLFDHKGPIIYLIKLFTHSFAFINI